MLSYDPSLCVLAYCLDSPSTKVKALVLKVSNACMTAQCLVICPLSVTYEVNGNSLASSWWA